MATDIPKTIDPIKERDRCWDRLKKLNPDWGELEYLLLHLKKMRVPKVKWDMETTGLAPLPVSPLSRCSRRSPSLTASSDPCAASEASSIGTRSVR